MAGVAQPDSTRCRLNNASDHLALLSTTRCVMGPVPSRDSARTPAAEPGRRAVVASEQRRAPSHYRRLQQGLSQSRICSVRREHSRSQQLKHI